MAVAQANGIGASCRQCLPLIAISVVAACTNEEGQCTSFPDHFENANLAFYNFASVPLENERVQRLADTVMECSPRSPYAGPQNTMRIVSAHRMGNGDLVLVFELYGIADLRLLFRVDKDGHVVGAYQTSLA